MYSLRQTGRSALRTRLAIFTAALALPLVGCGDDGAARQKDAEDIAKAIEGQFALMGNPAEPVTLRHDKVTVTPSTTDKSFMVAITGLRFGDAKGEDGVTVGEVDYRLTPGDNNTYQVDQLKLPAEFPVVAAGKPVATLRMTSGPLSAIWSTPLHNFQKFVWQADNLAVSALDKPDLAIHADRVAMNGDGKDDGKGRLDAAMDIVVSNVAVSAPTEAINFKVAKIEEKAVITGFDFPAYQQQMLKLRTLIAKFTPAAVAASGVQSGDQSGTGTAQTPAPVPAKPSLTDEDRKAMADVVAALPKTVSGYSASFLLEGVVVTGPDGSTPFRMAHGQSDLAFKEIDTDKAEFDLALKHDGLEVQMADANDPRAQAILPKSGDLSLRATNLPVASLFQALAKTLPELTSGDETRVQAAHFALMGAFMTTLGQSNIKLTVDPSWLDAPKAHLTADGVFTLATGMPSGTLNLGLIGLDDVTALFNATPDPISMNALPILQQMHDLAKREAGAEGKPVNKYTVIVAPGGAITVNGKPMGGGL